MKKCEIVFQINAGGGGREGVGGIKIKTPPTTHCHIYSITVTVCVEFSCSMNI